MMAERNDLGGLRVNSASSARQFVDAHLHAAVEQYQNVPMDADTDRTLSIELGSTHQGGSKLRYGEGELTRKLYAMLNGQSLSSAYRQALLKAGSTFPSLRDVHRDSFLSYILLSNIPMMNDADMALPPHIERKDEGEFTRVDAAPFRRAPDDEAARAVGDRAREIYFNYGKVTFKTITYSLRTFVPTKLVRNQDNPAQLVSMSMMLCAHNIMNIRNKLVGAFLTDGANYMREINTGNYLTGDTVDMPQVIHNLQNLVEDTSTKRPMCLIANENTMKDIIFHSSLYDDGGGARDRTRGMSIQQRLDNARVMLGLNKLLVYRSSRNTANLQLNPTDKGKSSQMLAKNFPDNKVALIAGDRLMTNSTSFACLIYWGSRNLTMRSYRVEDRDGVMYEAETSFIPWPIDADAGALIHKANIA